jgi:uncharacterized membrane protein (GlpM family)
MDQDTKTKPNFIDKIIGTFCYFAIAINLNMAWSKGYKGNDTIKLVIGHIIFVFGGLIFYALFIHRLPRSLRILIGILIWCLNLYIIFNYKEFIYFIKYNYFAI